MSVLEFYPRAAKELSQYIDILASRGIAWGLVGPREIDRLWDRHVLNSLALAGVLPQDLSVVDVGSGAGLPGIPVALARPDLTMTLLEPLKRRFEFLHSVVDELGLSDRVTVIRGRAEDSDGTYDAVIARAVAPLERLVRWCTPLFYPEGHLFALKGQAVNDEVKAAAKILGEYGMTADVMTVRAHPGAEVTYVAVVGC